MIQLVLYDLDGTLADTRKDICMSVNHMIRELGAEPMEDREIEKFVGLGLNHLIENSLRTQDSKRIEKGSKIYRAYYQKHMLDYTTLYPDAEKVLEHFRDRPQAVITNKPDPFTTEILKSLKIDKYFFEIIPGNGRYPRKPEPTSILEKLREKNVMPQDALFVGDSEIDIETARNAGVRLAVISHGFVSHDQLESLKPDYLFKDFGEMLTHIQKERW